MDDRLNDTFPGKVIPKQIALMPPFDRLPRYVAEYLVAKFARDGEPAQVERLAEFVLRHYPTAEQRNWAKDQLLRNGRLVLIDELRVKPDLTTGRHFAELSTLGDVTATVSGDLCDRYPSTLYGLWGTLDLRYDPRKREVNLAGFIPFSVVADLDSFIRGRTRFSDDEWIDVLLNAVGLNPGRLSARQKELNLARLAPLVEPRLQLMELGPRQTGKSFLLRNTSPDVFLVSSSSVSPATLFYHQVSRRPGLVSAYPVLVFDEIGHGRWVDRELIGTLNDFMESGRFSRGGRQFSAQTSLVFLGNTDSPATPQTALLPRGLAGETGFLDRLNGLIPGHELPKITRDLLYQGPGLAVDYLAQALRMLRAQVIDIRVASHLPPSFKERDVRSVQRLVSAFLKLVYPGRNWQEGHLERWVSLAMELRDRVWQELSSWNPAEFPPRQATAARSVEPEVVVDPGVLPLDGPEQ
ncbi:MAG: BREX system Lon protease-like protein BrxL [Candidatus Binatia bacterium]|nr:BREX system Lon protease-like protein BrxL [Candidatus Binatia bacterium]